MKSSVSSSSLESTAPRELPTRPRPDEHFGGVGGPSHRLLRVRARARVGKATHTHGGFSSDRAWAPYDRLRGRGG